MVKLNQGYMVSHMRNDNGKVNVKNTVLAAACEASEVFQSMLLLDKNIDDWMSFVDKLDHFLSMGNYDSIHDLCQTVYGMKNRREELDGLYMVRDDGELCALYYDVFVGLLDVSLSTAESMIERGTEDE